MSLSFRTEHSPETALIQMTNYRLTAADCGHISIYTRGDTSAAPPPPHWPLHSYHTNSSVYLLRNSSSGRAPVLKHLEQTGVLAFTKMFFSSKPQFSIPKEICEFKQCRRICPILTCWMLKQRIFWMWASRLLNTQLIPRLKHSHKHSSATSLLLRRGPMNHCTVVYDHMASFLNFLLWSMLCWLILFCVWWFCCFLHALIMHSIMQWNRWKKNHKITTPPFKVNQCRRRLLRSRTQDWH